MGLWFLVLLIVLPLPSNSSPLKPCIIIKLPNNCPELVLKFRGEEIALDDCRHIVFRGAHAKSLFTFDIITNVKKPVTSHLRMGTGERAEYTYDLEFYRKGKKVRLINFSYKEMDNAADAEYDDKMYRVIEAARW